MRALRKGQASAFNITRDIRGEARIVERAFGLGGSILAEAVQFVSGELDFESGVTGSDPAGRLRAPSPEDCNRAIARDPGQPSRIPRR